MSNTGDHRRGKAPGAFRTISEVADDLGLAQHVLRFWESKFPQIKPMKRGGGRRYYRPEDVDLLRQIQAWLYQDGFTIKGVQKLLREGAHRRATPVSSAPVPSEATKAAPASLTIVPTGTRPATDTLATDDVKAGLESLLAKMKALRAGLARSA